MCPVGGVAPIPAVSEQHCHEYHGPSYCVLHLIECVTLAKDGYAVFLYISRTSSQLKSSEVNPSSVPLYISLRSRSLQSPPFLMYLQVPISSSEPRNAHPPARPWECQR